jgi:hypothetical protein
MRGNTVQSDYDYWYQGSPLLNAKMFIDPQYLSFFCPNVFMLVYMRSEYMCGKHICVCIYRCVCVYVCYVYVCVYVSVCVVYKKRKTFILFYYYYYYRISLRQLALEIRVRPYESITRVLALTFIPHCMYIYTIIIIIIMYKTIGS